MRKLKMGIIGGGKGAFIGAVHRMAASLDGRAELVAGCMSSDPARAKESGREAPWNLADDRNYGTWQEMLERELARPVGDGSGAANARIDFVTVVTPNHAHAPIAGAFARAGFNVVCDKPLCMNSAEARELAAAHKQGGGVFAVTYNYSGYPMVKQARHMVAQGELGEIRKVIVEYNQGWLASKLEQSGQKQADWRTDPRRAGIGGAIGDIGSHAEHLLRYITGLEIAQICADLTSFVPGRALDDDANLLLRLSSGARGILTCSQVCIGGENDLRIRVWGTKAGLEWRQEEPNALYFRADGKPEQVLRRGNAYLCPAAQAANRIPAGHPEAFIEAFANVYRGAFEAMVARRSEVARHAVPGAGKAAVQDSRHGVPAHQELDYPTLEDGARGVHFIEKTVESSRSELKWTDCHWLA